MQSRNPTKEATFHPLNGYLMFLVALALPAGAIATFVSGGHRPEPATVIAGVAFLVMLLGSAIALPATFLLPTSYSTALLLLPLLGFFSNGIFSGFPIYLPELYPTRIRATGAGFCFNAGRVLAAAGPFITGALVAQLGSFARAASAVAVIYLFGVLVLAKARETKGEVLQ